MIEFISAVLYFNIYIVSLLSIQSLNIIIIFGIKSFLTVKVSTSLNFRLGDCSRAGTSIFKPIIWLKLWNANILTIPADRTTKAAPDQDQVKNNWENAGKKCKHYNQCVRVSAWKCERLNYTITFIEIRNARRSKREQKHTQKSNGYFLNKWMQLTDTIVSTRPNAPTTLFMVLHRWL